MTPNDINDMADEAKVDLGRLQMQQQITDEFITKNYPQAYQDYHDMKAAEEAESERVEYASLLQQNSDKWGVSQEANEKVIKDLSK